MNNFKEYYKPELSDFFVGYELQLFAPEVGHWGWYTIKETDSPSDFIEAMEIDNVRTPFLTKEQIEAEGWKFTTLSQDLWFEKEGYFTFHNFETDKIRMHYGAKSHEGFSDLRMTIVADDRGEDYKLFEGECPSINEFKKIMEWLKIKN